jgi:hypothetical protein
MNMNIQMTNRRKFLKSILISLLGYGILKSNIDEKETEYVLRYTSRPFYNIIKRENHHDQNDLLKISEQTKIPYEILDKIYPI